MSTGRTALEGIRVLDVTQVMAGPFCAMQLCDMGADVIKVEPPGGDSTRRMAGASGVESAGFNAVNRGKRGIVLDIGTPRGQEVMRRLVATTDIFIENYRPGVMRRFGLDYATLAPDHRALIYASISGYGQTGPDAPKGGFDLIAQGVSGLMSVTGEPGRPPVKVGVPLTDLGAALFALTAILAALHYRHRTGLGQYIDTSLVEAGIALSVWEATEYFSADIPPEPLGSAHRMLAPYQAIRCADGYITLAAGTDRLFERLCTCARPPGLDGRTGFRQRHAQGPQSRDAHRTHRGNNHAAATRALARPLPRRERAVRANQRLQAGVRRPPSARTRDGRRRRTSDQPLGPLQTLGSPIKMSATPPLTGRRAPLLGEHTREVLGEMRYSEREIREVMVDAGLAV